MPQKSSNMVVLASWDQIKLLQNEGGQTLPGSRIFSLVSVWIVYQLYNTWQVTPVIILEVSRFRQITLEFSLILKTQDVKWRAG